MKFEKIITFLVFFLFSFVIAADQLGPEVSTYDGEELKWEDGARSFFIMFRSMLDNESDENELPGNPQGDTCKNTSTYDLTASDVPLEAFVDRAFLVWTSATEPGSNEVDNKVNLNFSQSDDKFSHSAEIAGPERNINSSSQGFKFESVRNTNNPDQAYYTYRIDITDFFQTLHEKGIDAGVSFDGQSLHGEYTLSNLDCTDDDAYINESVAVCGWSIILIYTDPTIKPKMMYIYNGFDRFFHREDIINVTGFIFPKNPIIRLSLNTFEGDPGNAVATYQGTNATPEGLQVQGDATDWLFVENECNPETQIDDGMGNFLIYTEIYNSVSSQYGYGIDPPIQCIGGTPPNYDLDKMQYGMDADTFVLNTETDDALRNHFSRGGENLKLKIGANQDMAITNYLIVSVDTKDPDFNIPERPEKVACTPSDESVDYLSDTYNIGYLCKNTEFWYAVRVQNWGEDVATAIKVRDDLDPRLQYVSGTTMYTSDFKAGTWEAKDKDSSWTAIPDKDGGAFPLSESGFKITDSLDNCVWDNVDTPEECSNRYLVRYKVKVADIAKNAIVPNRAEIYAGGQQKPYQANKGLGVKLKVDQQCGGTDIQPAILAACGGPVGDIQQCTSDEDCGPGKSCDTETGNCELTCNETENQAVSISRGENDPNGGESEIIVPKNSTDLTLAQIKMKAEGTGENDCMMFKQLNFEYDRSDNSVKLSNVRLVHDADGNGSLSDKDSVIATGTGMDNNAISFTVDDNSEIVALGEARYFIAVADAVYDSTASISSAVTFSTSLSGTASALFEDAGTPDIQLTDNDSPVKKIQFSTFMFEPDEGIIASRGENNPVNSGDPVSGETPVLQIKLTSKEGEEVVRVMNISIADGNYVKFNSGISEVLVYADNDGDGTADGQPLNAGATSNFSGASSMTVSGLNVTIPADGSTHLMIHCNFTMGKDENAKIQVGNISLESGNTNIYGLPVTSLEVGGMENGTPEPDDGCACTTMATTQATSTHTVLILLAGALLLFVVSRLAIRRS